MKQILIEIDDEVYEGVTGDTTFRDDERKALNAIRNGTVLPNNHGRLIDADAEIKQMYENYCENCDRRRGMKDGKLTKHFVYDIGDAPCRACDMGDMIDYLDDAPTILEAKEQDT